jgi:mannose-6-phosphate isomerase
LEPIFVERIWGTADLRPWYDHVTVPGEQDPIGEVWLTGDECRVADGPWAGKSLAEVFAAHAREILGPDVPAAFASAGSPLLLKVIFAREKLSVQVHPDDRLAQKYGEPRGKTECWYALAAEAGAQVAVGLKPGVTLAGVEEEVSDGTLERSLNLLPVTAGDMIFVDAGTVHAIWPGSVLLETQQNCDLTYRLFDYGRPRQLHVARALEALRLETAAGKISPIALPGRTVLVASPYFTVERIVVDRVRPGSSMSGTGESATGLTYLFAASGRGTISAVDGTSFAQVPLAPRGVAAVPALAPEWQIADAGGLELIRITPRWPSATETDGPKAG